MLLNEFIDIGKNEEWLMVQFKAHNVTDIRHVFLAKWLENDGVFLKNFD